MSTELIDLWTVETVAEPAVKVAKRNTGAATLDEARAFIARFASMPSDAALDVAALWAAMSHTVDTNERLAFDTSPRLIFLSDKPASGKTVAMESVLRLCFKGMQVVDPTPATFAQMVSEDRATVGFDEIDVAFGKGAAKATLRSLLNAGYRRNATWARANRPPVSIFSALTMAGLGKHFRTSTELAPLRSRSIVVEMQPANPPEIYRARLHDAMATHIRESLTTWAKRNLAEITESWPTPPEGIAARQAEVAEPLLQIADAAGGHWPETARTALKELLLGEMPDSADDTPLGHRLLLDLKHLFTKRGAATLSTVDIVDALYAAPGSPWRALWPNRNTAPRELAAMLAPMGIAPCPVWVDERTVRGYHRDALQPMWDEVFDPESDL